MSEYHGTRNSKIKVSRMGDFYFGRFKSTLAKVRGKVKGEGLKFRHSFLFLYPLSSPIIINSPVARPLKLVPAKRA